MPDAPGHPLAPYGWDERVAAWFADPGSLTDEPVEPARVVRVERSACFVAVADGERTAIARELPAVGDWAAVTTNSDPPRVAAVLPRWAQLVRQDSTRRRVQVLAANIDLVLVLAPADRLSVGRVEREITAAWDSGARPVVVLTKVDLLDVDGTNGLDDLAAQLAFTEMVATSSVRGDGMDELRALLQPCRTAVLFGPSGAGKSTLANALLGEERLATGAVRDADQRGRHTTTSRQLVTVPSGGVLIDTPGLRSLALTADSEDLEAAFADIDELAADCRFRDCAHEAEPGCAVVAAAEEGALDARRLESYRKLQRELAFESRRHDPLARQETVRVWKSITKDLRRHRRPDTPDSSDRPHRPDR